MPSPALAASLNLALRTAAAAEARPRGVVFLEHEASLPPRQMIVRDPTARQVKSQPRAKVERLVGVVRAVPDATAAAAFFAAFKPLDEHFLERRPCIRRVPLLATRDARRKRATDPEKPCWRQMCE